MKKFFLLILISAPIFAEIRTMFSPDIFSETTWTAKGESISFYKQLRYVGKSPKPSIYWRYKFLKGDKTIEYGFYNLSYMWSQESTSYENKAVLTTNFYYKLSLKPERGAERSTTVQLLFYDNNDTPYVLKEGNIIWKKENEFLL